MSLPQIGHRTLFIVRLHPRLRGFSEYRYFAGPSDLGAVVPEAGGDEPLEVADELESAGFAGVDSAFSAFL